MKLKSAGSILLATLLGAFANTSGVQALLANNRVTPAPGRQPVVGAEAVSKGSNTARSTDRAALPSLSFACVSYGSRFATIIRTPEQAIPLITWNNPKFGTEFTPEKRCQIVTQKFQTAVDTYGVENLMFTTGRVGGRNVICLINGGQQGCNPSNTLLSLSGANALEPRKLLEQLLSIGTTGSGSPIQERRGKEFVSFTTVLERALQSANTQPAPTEEIPQQPRQDVPQQPSRLF